MHEHASNNALLWHQSFTYDRYGNRTINAGGTSDGINKQSFEVETATNRLLAPGDSALSASYPSPRKMRYDAAGNLTNDNWSSYGSSTAGAITRTYDAENRMTSAWDSSGGTSYYTYNGDGQRVRRKTGSVETWQVYGMDGELLAEYVANAALPSPQKEYGYRNGQLLITAEAAQTSAPVNLALNKPATQSSTYIYGDPTPNLAVDGNTDGVWLDHSVASTNNEAQAWWQVDLGSTTAVSSVEVWNRTDCCPERLSNFNVMLLDANQATVVSINVPVQAGTPTTVQISGTARYVKVQLVGTNFLSLAEVKVWSTAAAAANINWLVTDQLGTPRMIFDKTGSLAATKRHDYLPFGEEIFGGTGGRTTAQGYSVADGVRQKFTQKERDNETGLDYFGARYYASLQGRFTGPDDFFKDSQLDDPQGWNKYAYVRNNPLALIDPSGEKAKVTVTVDKKNKTGRIDIEASVAVFAASGQDVTESELEEHAQLVKKQIEGTYSGSFTENGITYTLTAHIDVQVVESESKAVEGGKSGKFDNIFEVGDRQLVDREGGTAQAAVYRLRGEQFDRARINVDTNQDMVLGHNLYGHESTHMLGSGTHLRSGVSSKEFPTRSSLSAGDFRLLFGRQLRIASRRANPRVEETRRAPLASPRRIYWK